MGIYDREYIRGDSSTGPGFFATTPVTKWLIVINVAVFFLQSMDLIPPEVIREWLEATPSHIFKHGRVWELLTATFLHADPMHLVLNMLFFWFIGREIETMYGSRDFLAFYLSAAVISTLVWAIVQSLTGDPTPLVGASGAVMAVAMLYVLYYPRREILVFFVLPVEAWILGLIYVFWQVFTLIKGNSYDAVEAHLAGVAYGFLFKEFDLRWSRMPWMRARRPRFRLITPEPREKPSSGGRAPTSKPSWATNSAAASKPTSASVAVIAEEQLDARVDEILAKIAREGRTSLTDEENRILQEASRRARDKRSDRL